MSSIIDRNKFRKTEFDHFTLFDLVVLKVMESIYQLLVIKTSTQSIQPENWLVQKMNLKYFYCSNWIVIKNRPEHHLPNLNKCNAFQLNKFVLCHLFLHFMVCMAQVHSKNVIVDDLHCDKPL
jgi:hypothetical protein